MKLLFKFLHCVIIIFEDVFCDGDSSNKIIVTFAEVHGNGLKIEGDINKMELREGQQVTITAELRTRSGNPATYEAGSIGWESSDESIATVEVNPENELQAIVKGVDGSENGSAVVTFRADGDPDADETRNLVGTLDVVVTQGEAVVVSLATGPVSDIEDIETEPEA